MKKLLLKLKDFLFKIGLFRKRKPDPIMTMDELMVLDLKHFGDVTPEIFGEENVVKDKPTLLLVDDEESMMYIYKNCFRRIKTFTDEDDIYRDFVLLPAFGMNSGLVAFRTIKELDKIDFAILDLTLSYTFKVVPEFCSNPDYLYRTVVLDGVDLAIELYKKNPDIKLKFLTSHSNDFSISTIRPYAEKFKSVFKKDIEDYYIGKDSKKKCNRIYRFLYGKDPKGGLDA